MSMVNQAPLTRPVTLERLQWQPNSMRVTPASVYRDPEFLINLKGYIEALLPFDGPPLRLRREAHEATARRWRPRGTEIITPRRYALLYHVGAALGHEAGPKARECFRLLVTQCPEVGLFGDAIDRIIDGGKADRLTGDLIHQTSRELRLDPEYLPTIAPFIRIM
ncbi:hypothetical protein D3874_04800 [Oleomonas cavernae]|uniref:Uncharacterized protein n=1 Tax=Oleomonas cavernae TaxID=2320859 RepID=A0A418W8W1_9PROT|nr:hypothetical protein [Oleomonas cavernae]RJF86428.1 hypothetical protein D3874_04800 [Oleomonas cavernae]